MNQREKENKHILAILEQVKKEKNVINQPMFNDTTQDFKIEILPNKKIAPAKFIPSQLATHVYYAHPDTIKAMKKNLFCFGNDIDATIQLEKCSKCKQDLDIQFWHHCPFCGADFNH